MNTTKSPYPISSQCQLRRAFRAENPDLNMRRTVRMGSHLCHVTDTRCAFVDWLDFMVRNGQVSAKLAERATL